MEKIKFWEPVETAWERMTGMLFQPFDLEKWIILGFSAWISGASLGSGINLNFNSSQNLNLDFQSTFDGTNPLSTESVQLFFDKYGVFIIPTVTITTLLVILILWITSRGHFVFLDNVIKNKAEIVEPWKSFQQQGNSFFLWKLLITMISLIFLGAIISLIVIAFMTIEGSNSALPLNVIGISLFCAVLFFGSLLLGFSQLLINDFVTPIMLHSRLRIKDAWIKFCPLLKAHFGKFILYVLIRFIIDVGIGIAMIALLFLCCCIVMFMQIPYIGTVILLPIIVFLRLISIEFIRQFGTDYDFHTPKEPANTVKYGETTDPTDLR